MTDIIQFPNPPELEQTVTKEGKTVTVKIFRAEQKGQWYLEIVDQFWGSTVWDDTFTSPQEALQEAITSIEQDGIDQFIGQSNQTSLADNIPTVNRCAIVIRYKQPFIDWINSIEPKYSTTLEEANQESHLYLADEVDSDFDPEPHILVRALCEEIFESELMSWFTDTSLWPQNRNWKLFQTMFDYSVMSLVYDLGAVPLTRDE